MLAGLGSILVVRGGRYNWARSWPQGFGLAVVGEYSAVVRQETAPSHAFPDTAWILALYWQREISMGGQAVIPGVHPAVVAHHGKVLMRLWFIFGLLLLAAAPKAPRLDLHEEPPISPSTPPREPASSRAF